MGISERVRKRELGIVTSMQKCFACVWCSWTRHNKPWQQRRRQPGAIRRRPVLLLLL